MTDRRKSARPEIPTLDIRQVLAFEQQWAREHQAAASPETPRLDPIAEYADAEMLEDAWR